MTTFTGINPSQWIAIAILLVAPCAAAAADTLNNAAAKTVIANRTWRQPQAHGSGKVYWTWKSDGSTCLRTDGPKGKCADTGHWRLDGGRMCYELTWWGASVGRKSACFRIADKGKNQYEAIQDSGFTLFEFSVVR